MFHCSLNPKDKTIEKVMAKSGVELGLDFLLGKLKL